MPPRSLPLLRLLLHSLRPRASHTSRSYRRGYPTPRTGSSTGDTPPLGYRTIGSFHSDDVEVLNALPPEEYSPPDLPFDVPEAETAATSSPDVGAERGLRDDFLLDNRGGDDGDDDRGWAFLNHGAFGAALRPAHVRASAWRDYTEAQPLRYFDRDLLPHLVHTNRLLADFLGADRRRCAPVQNVTSAMNSVIGGYAREFGRDALVMYLDTSYGSVKKMVRHYCGDAGGEVVEIPFQDERLPLRPPRDGLPPGSEFMDALDGAISRIKRTCPPGRLQDALLILDHTTSNTAINVPIESLASRAKEEGMLVLVDGAHGPLARDVDLTDLADAGVDFYACNAHKWMSSPRGAGMLYCSDEGLRDTALRTPAVISHGVDDGFLSRFLWDGCRDYAAQLSVPPAIEYWRNLRPEVVRARMRDTLVEGVGILARTWHGPALGCLGGGGGATSDDLLEAEVTVAPVDMLSPMALVRLPDFMTGRPGQGRMTSADARGAQDYLYGGGVEVPVKCVGGALYVRISSHIYNRPEEYKRLGRLVMNFPGQ